MLFFSFKGICQITPANNEIMGSVVTSGSNASGSSGTIAYSIGQVFYTYIGSEMIYNVAQGIQHQEKEDIIEVPQLPETKTEIVVFPNPTIDIVNINMDATELENDQCKYKIYDIQGRLLKANLIKETTTQISLNYLSPSIYLLVVYSSDNKMLKTFKIIKK